MKYTFLTTKIAALERTAKRKKLKDVKGSEKVRYPSLRR